jgi:hypothetical protein
MEDFPAQLSYALGASLADLGRAFSGAYSDILTGSRGAFAEIGTGLARVQSSQIAGRSGRAFAQAFGSLTRAFANVLTALAHVFAGAGPGFLLLSLRAGLRLPAPLILTCIRGTREGRQAQKDEDARRQKNRAELRLRFHFPFSQWSIPNDNHFLHLFDALKSKAGGG